MRDYGLPPVEWGPVTYAPMAGMAEIEVPGCDPECAHEWIDKPWKNPNASGGAQGGSYSTASVGRNLDGWKVADYHSRSIPSQWCHLCGGWRGSLGLERTPEMYVGHLVAVFREVRRVMRGDGTLWLNLGSSYQNKQEMGIPWRVAFALQADNWILRSDIVWAKGISFCPTYSGSCMPESVRDRPTKGHEFVYLLAKSARYFYDADAVKEQSQGQNGQAANFARTTKDHIIPRQGVRQHREDRKPTKDTGTRNLRSVWAINPGSFPGAHFATWPPALVEPMIKAGTSERGCCPECGASWVRVVEREPARSKKCPKTDALFNAQGGEGGKKTGTIGMSGGGRIDGYSVTTGWTPTCTCNADSIPCTVLDPFFGAGTTGLVCERLGVDSIGIELSQEYVQMAQERIVNDAPMLNQVEVVRSE